MPQGSILRPVFFIIQMNNIDVEHISSIARLADDTTIGITLVAYWHYTGGIMALQCWHIGITLVAYRHYTGGILALHWWYIGITLVAY